MNDQSSVRAQLLTAAEKMRGVAEIAEQEAIRLETMAALLPMTPEIISSAQAETERIQAAALLKQAEANHVQKKTDQIREVHHEAADDRKEEASKKREATLRDRLRTKVHLIPMALIFVAAVIGLVLVLRYA